MPKHFKSLNNKNILLKKFLHLSQKLPSYILLPILPFPYFPNKVKRQQIAYVWSIQSMERVSWTLSAVKP